ncbi:TrbI/VirB10 family protein [Vitreimonas flagellata]|uniref:TrbI/VirB10 family protein n=1 Tax=Vitreimonas flagellata TaxID=2560861 RepID=UPI001074E63D|nr:TrbI/VirB10 family protein [Vitreimonas flagellata]
MTNSTTGASDDEVPIRPKPHIPPTISIRASAPKPRRLSRKLLMGGALLLGSAIALALLQGLSRPERERRAETESQQSQANISPPEAIREAPDTYDANTLAPPIDPERDYFWGDQGPPGGASEANENAPAPGAGNAASAPAQSQSPDLADAESARISGLLFSRTRSNTRSVSTEDSAVLQSGYRPPQSRFTLQAGSTISAALLTALNSDQPGRVIAQVSENVFDSVTGNHLLIPQGARLIGAYDADTRYGDQRLRVTWRRLIMPNGWSISLEDMPGTDAAGTAGLSGQADAHLGRIAFASILSGVLSVAANEAESDDEDRVSASVGDASAQEAARVGGRLVDRELDVRPTLRIRAGARVRVLVSQDIILGPYRP